MQGLEHLEEDDSDTVFRDVIFLALAGFVAIVLLLLPHLNPPAKAEEEARSPGNVIVEIRWPDEINADVDLWVEAPGDVPVGYSNKGGTIFNLLRRGIPEGEYTVNLHLYRDLSGNLPIQVSVVVSVKPSPEQAAKQVLATKVPLKVEGQEVTAFRFILDEKARVVTGSVHDLPKALRSKKS
jgi:hypothetical protein